MSTEQLPKLATDLPVIQKRAPSFWDGLVPTWLQSGTPDKNIKTTSDNDRTKAVEATQANTVVAKANPVAAQANTIVAKANAVVAKASVVASKTNQDAGDALFKGWTQLQSANTSHVHTINHYKMVEEDDFCILEVDKDELARSRQASIKAEQVYLKKYAAKEFLAHILPYQIPKTLVNGDKVNVLEEDGSTSDYACHRLESGHKGLVGYVLLPTKANAQGRYEMKVVFRGTNPSDPQCIKRNLEPKGAGSVSFEANSPSLLSQINQHMKALGEQYAIGEEGLDLGIYGHSLGGADTLNCAAKILQAIAERNGIVGRTEPLPKEKIDQFHSIRKLHVNTANAAGVPLETALQSNELLKKLAEKRARSETTFEIPESYNIQVGGDGVQATGEAHVFSNISADHCKVDVLKAHIGAEHHNKLTIPKAAAAVATSIALNGVTGGAATVVATVGIVASAAAGLYDTKVAHTSKLFPEPRTATFSMMSNATPAGQKQVAAELNKKSWWLGAIHNTALTVGNGLSAIGFKTNRSCSLGF